MVGIILIPVGLYLIGWNEYRTVQTESAIDLGTEALVPADCDRLDAGLNGALVHLACDISGNGDSALNISVPPAITASQNGVDATEAQLAGTGWHRHADEHATQAHEIIRRSQAC